uniref:Uncharacterized protein n=1 Tax=Schizaphis graminum TaxID=13262 RepID=A0A2S2PQW7_SCHGA
MTSTTAIAVMAEYGTHTNSLRSLHSHGRTAQINSRTLCRTQYMGCYRGIPENTRRQQWFLDSILFTYMAGSSLNVLYRSIGAIPSIHVQHHVFVQFRTFRTMFT